MKPIISVPHAVLTTPAKRVTRFDKNLRGLITTMGDVLIAARNPKGVGLAAPQIGEPWRIFITRPKESDAIRVFINPEIIQTDIPVADKTDKLEGCLSIPKIWGKVRRAQTLTLRFQDDTGKIHTEVFSGFMATIIQHETDHVNGILFTHRALEQKEKLYQTMKDTNGKEVLEEILLR